MKSIKTLSAVLALTVGLSVAAGVSATGRGYFVTPGATEKKELTDSEKSAEFRKEVTKKLNELKKQFEAAMKDIAASSNFVYDLANRFCDAAMKVQDLEFKYSNLTPVNHYKEQAKYIQALGEVTNKGVAFTALSLTPKFAKDNGGVYAYNGAAVTLETDKLVYVGLDVDKNVHGLKARLDAYTTLTSNAVFTVENAGKTLHDALGETKLTDLEKAALETLGYDEYATIFTLGYEPAMSLKSTLDWYNLPTTQAGLKAIVDLSKLDQVGILHIAQELTKEKAQLAAFTELYKDLIVNNKEFANQLNLAMTKHNKDVCPVELVDVSEVKPTDKDSMKEDKMKDHDHMMKDNVPDTASSATAATLAFATIFAAAAAVVAKKK